MPKDTLLEAGPRGRGQGLRLLVAMLLAVLLALMLPLPDWSAHGHPLYMRLPPSTLRGEPGLEGSCLGGGGAQRRASQAGECKLAVPTHKDLCPSAHPAGRRSQGLGERKGRPRMEREGDWPAVPWVCSGEGSQLSRRKGPRTALGPKEGNTTTAMLRQ